MEHPMKADIENEIWEDGDQRNDADKIERSEGTADTKNASNCDYTWWLKTR
jgi:hypothetical protein